MVTTGLPWLAACAAVGAAWLAAVSWRSDLGAGVAAVRGGVGGIAALLVASLAYDAFEVVGVHVRWESLGADAWSALALAALIGVVEEGAKLAGILVAAPSPSCARTVPRMTAAVAAVFAVVEAARGMPGATWSVALSRAALGPVAHALLAAPVAVALARSAGGSRWRLAVRLSGALLVASALHAISDWSVARPGWGQLGFAGALLVPAVWLYLRARTATAATPRPERGAFLGQLGPAV